VILASDQLGELVHRLLDDGRHGLVIGVAGLATLEEDVGVLGRAADYGVLGVHGPIAMGLNQFHVDHRPDVVLAELLDLVHFVRSAEAVEEVEERHPGFQRGGVGDHGHVLRLLHGGGGEHRPAGRSAGHHVAVVAEDRQRVGGHRSGGDVEHGGSQLAGDLEHVGDHQQQTLRGGEGAGQGPGLQRTVNGSGGTRLALHFGYVGDRAEDVLPSRRSPGVRHLAHTR